MSEKKEQKKLETPSLLENIAATLLEIKHDLNADAKVKDGRLNSIETRLANQAIKLTQNEETVEALRADHTTILSTLDELLSGEARGKEVEPLEWNPDKFNWEQAEGKAGPYERSEDINNPDFKNMLQELGRADGKLTRDGLFYWTFTNGTTVGRKKSRYPAKK